MSQYSWIAKEINTSNLTSHIDRYIIQDIKPEQNNYE